MARRRGLGRGGCRPSPGAAPPSVLTLRGAGCPPRRAPSSALPPRLQLSASFSQSEMAKWRCQTDTRGVPRPGQPRRDLRRERCTRRGVCVCVCVSVCQPVDRRKAESAYSSPSTWPDSAAGAPWRAVLGFTRAHLGPAAFAQPPTQTSASHSLQGTFPSPSSHLPSLSSSLVSRESEEGVTLHKPPL